MTATDATQQNAVSTGIAAIPRPTLRDGRSSATHHDAKALGTGTRHEWIDTLCDRLGRILVGRAAEQVLETSALPETGVLVVLPVWQWLPPRIDIGRKGRRRDGSTATMPVRISWADGLVLVVDGNASASWSMVGMGYSQQGSLVVTGGSTAIRVTELPASGGMVRGRTLPRRRLVAELENLVADGRTARWEALLSLEPYVSHEVRRASRAVSYDVLTGDIDAFEAPEVLDEEGRRKVADKMLLGDGDDPGRVTPLLERCLAPAAFVKVDPLKYVATDIHRSAQEEVRKAIGDPQTGRKIRQVARSMPDATVEEVVDAYRTLYPRDSMSASRVHAALTAGPDAMALAVLPVSMIDQHVRVRSGRRAA